MRIEKIKNEIARRMRAPASVARIEEMTNSRFLETLSRLGALEPGYLLDCGCGAGDKISDIERRCATPYQLVGLDIHYPSAARARGRVSENVLVVHGNGLSIPFREATFDMVLSNQVIEHIAEYEQYLAEIGRVLKPNGFLILSTPNAHCPRNTLLKLAGQKPILRWANVGYVPTEQFRGHVHEFTEEELLQVVSRFGFALVENHPVLPRATLGGNWLFNLYAFFELVFYVVTRPFVPKGYSKNTNFLLQLAK